MSPWLRILAVDLRALALFRMAVGGVLLFDLVTRAADRAAHYGEAGVLPSHAARALGGREVLLSLHLHASGEPLLLGALLLLAMALAGALLLGWRTRIAAVASWVLLASLHLRNPYVSRFGGDNFFLVLLFWGMFLPLGARWSLDARRGRARSGPAPDGDLLLSVPGAALLIQTFLLYFVTGWAKQGAAWTGGSALFYALHLDGYVTRIGLFVREHPAWLPPLTALALWFERLAPFVPFVPWRNGLFRMLGIALFLGLHLSIAAMLWVGWFPIFCLAAWPAFLPSELFDDWLPRLRGRAPRPPPTRSVGQPLFVQVAAALCLAYVVTFLVTEGGPWPTGGRLPGVVRSVGGKLLHLNQRWSMFSPDPPELDGWPRVEGVLDDGAHLDLLTGQPFREAKPDLVIDLFPSFRWRQFFESTWEDASQPSTRVLYREYARWLCERWAAGDPVHAGAGAARDGARLVRVRIHHAVEQTRPGGPSPQRLDLMGEHACPQP